MDIHSKCGYNRNCINNQQLPEGILLPLPLSLISFIGRWKQNTSILSSNQYIWITACNINNNAVILVTNHNGCHSFVVNQT